jgi:anthranilate synthase/phosphoribosyltransferase
MLLMIDNYDSFTYNLVQCFSELGEKVMVRRNDRLTIDDIDSLKPDRIVLSPGPGVPEEAGICVDIIRRFAPEIPILGVCLGHQAIGYAFGTPTTRTERIMHGKTSPIYHDGKTILNDVENPFEATRYHSLVIPREGLSADLEVSAWTREGEVMGIRHRSHLVEGIQFHPESILTKEGKKILRNFLDVSGKITGKKCVLEAIDKGVRRVDLTEDEMLRVMEAIMDGRASPAQIAAFITALRMKGETVDEIAGAARCMRVKALPIRVPSDKPLVDTCGTGGDRSSTFNISTTTAFVAAAAGAQVAKHGNRSVSSRCGSADGLERLGGRIDLPPDDVGRSIEEAGIGFLFAPLFHGSMKHAAAPRREVGIRTIFNILGPLTNPARARFQLLGVYDGQLCERLARVLIRLGAERAMVVHGLDGLDEITVTARTQVSEVRDGRVESYLFDPREHGIDLHPPDDLRGGNAEENARITRGILAGEIRGAKRDIVLINAAAALQVSGVAGTIGGGVEMSREAIDSGAALQKLEQLREASR